MILSHRHRFLFIKTEKTAGTSIEIDFQHLADTTGQAGVGFSEIVRAQINAGDVGGERILEVVLVVHGLSIPLAGQPSP